MSKEPKEQWYIAKHPGYSISLPEGMVYKEQIGGVTREHKVITFRARGGKMVKTTSPEIQKFLESCVAFKRGNILRVQTPEEIAKHKKLEEQNNNLKNYQDLANSLPINFREMNDSDARGAADKIGADTSADGKKLSKDDVIDNIEILVYGKVTSGKKTEKE